MHLKHGQNTFTTPAVTYCIFSAKEIALPEQYFNRNGSKKNILRDLWEARGGISKTGGKIYITYGETHPFSVVNAFTFTYLADAFIQSDLQCIQAIHFILSVCVFPGN